MKFRMWLLVALALIALLATGAPVFRDTHESASSTQVFATILHDSYAGWTGFHTCLPGPTPQHDLCWAELHRGGRYQLIGIDVDRSQANPFPRQIAHQAPWTRHPFHIAAPEGHGSANTLAYGWEWLMTSVPAKHLPTRFFDLDGDRTGYPPAMFSFRCTGVPTLITCRNALGDEITYTPSRP